MKTAIGIHGVCGRTGRRIVDLAHADPDITLAAALVSRTRVARLLQGFRDSARADLDAVHETLVRLSQLAVDFPGITCDINPLVAGPAGVMALDAWITIDRVPATGTAHLAIAPYPAELEETVRLVDGRSAVVRPIRPEDAEAHAAFFTRLSPEDVRRRFFAPIAALSKEQIARMTQIDYDREIAFVAVERVEGGPDRTVGVSRLIREGGGEEAEFAVIVDPSWKGQGLARHLMERLFEWGRAVGVTEVAGQVLADNRPMLAFVRSLGFSLRRSPEEEDVMEARLAL